jgi:hypothetical protein
VRLKAERGEDCGSNSSGSNSSGSNSSGSNSSGSNSNGSHVQTGDASRLIDCDETVLCPPLGGDRPSCGARQSPEGSLGGSREAPRGGGSRNRQTAIARIKNVLSPTKTVAAGWRGWRPPADLPSTTRVIVVAARESDIVDVFGHAMASGRDLLLRAARDGRWLEMGG